jgi:hypothetical protein
LGRAGGLGCSGDGTRDHLEVSVGALAISGVDVLVALLLFLHLRGALFVVFSHHIAVRRPE